MDDSNINIFLPFHSVTNLDFERYIQSNSTNNLTENVCNEQIFDFDYINNLYFEQFENYIDDNDLLNDFF